MTAERKSSPRLSLALAAMASLAAATAAAWVAVPEDLRPVLVVAGVIAGTLLAIQLAGGSGIATSGTIAGAGIAAVLLSLDDGANLWLFVAVAGFLLAGGELSAMSVAYARLDPAAERHLDARLEGSAILVGAATAVAVAAAVGATLDVGGGLVLVAVGALAAAAIARLVGFRPRSAEREQDRP